MTGLNVAFLRGINVGGHRVTGPELAAAFEAAGCASATTFLASGNVVFEGSADEAALEMTLAERLGYAVPTFVRSAAEVRAIVASDPFAEADRTDAGKPQVLFLRTNPAPATAKAIAALAPPGERLEVIGREVRWLPAAGILDSDLDLDELTRLGGQNTMRTANTVTRIATKFLAV